MTTIWGISPRFHSPFLSMETNQIGNAAARALTVLKMSRCLTSAPAGLIGGFAERKVYGHLNRSGVS